MTLMTLSYAVFLYDRNMTPGPKVYHEQKEKHFHQALSQSFQFLLRYISLSGYLYQAAIYLLTHTLSLHLSSKISIKSPASLH